VGESPRFNFEVQGFQEQTTDKALEQAQKTYKDGETGDFSPRKLTLKVFKGGGTGQKIPKKGGRSRGVRASLYFYAGKGLGEKKAHIDYV